MVQEVGQHRWWVPFKPTILGRGSRTTGDGGGEGESSWLGGVGGAPAVRGMVVHRPGGGDGLVSRGGRPRGEPIPDKSKNERNMVRR
jgi:hypothetical protein